MIDQGSRPENGCLRQGILEDINSKINGSPLSQKQLDGSSHTETPSHIPDWGRPQQKDGGCPAVPQFAPSHQQLRKGLALPQVPPATVSWGKRACPECQGVSRRGNICTSSSTVARAQRLPKKGIICAHPSNVCGLQVSRGNDDKYLPGSELIPPVWQPIRREGF